MNEQYKLLDAILVIMKDGKSFESLAIATTLQIDHDLCVRLLLKLYREGYATQPLRIAPGSINAVTKITHVGREFIIDNGGYTSLHEKEVQNSIKDKLEFTKLQDEVYKLQLENQDYSGKLARERQLTITSWITTAATIIGAFIAYFALKCN